MERRRAARSRANHNNGDIPLRSKRHGAVVSSSSTSGGRRRGGIRQGSSSATSALTSLVPSSAWQIPLHELLFLALVEGNPDEPKGRCRAMFGLLPRALAAALVGDFIACGDLLLRKPASSRFGGIKKPVLVAGDTKLVKELTSTGGNDGELDASPSTLREQALRVLLRLPLTAPQAVEILAHGKSRNDLGLLLPSTGTAPSRASESPENEAALKADVYRFSVEEVFQRGLYRLPMRTGTAVRSWTDAQLVGSSRVELKQCLETLVWRALQTPTHKIAEKRTARERVAAEERAVPPSQLRELRFAALYFAVDPMLRCAPKSATPEQRREAKKRGVELCSLIDGGSAAQIVDSVLAAILDRQRHGVELRPPQHRQHRRKEVEEEEK